MEIINEELLDGVCAKANESPRLRMNHNFHDSLDAKAQILLNALEPGTVMPVHRHEHTAETYIVLRGRLKVIYCNDRKEVIESCILDPRDRNYGIHIPKGQWHTLEVMEKDTVIFEVKEGPYTPLTSDNILK